VVECFDTGVPNAFRGQRCVLMIHEPTDDDEFVAAPANNDIGVARDLLEHTRESVEQSIAGRVAVSVVDFFEAVEIEQKEHDVGIVGRGLSLSRCPVTTQARGEIGFDRLLEIATVACAGQRVGYAHLLD
jgi:hypothetical protein